MTAKSGRTEFWTFHCKVVDFGDVIMGGLKHSKRNKDGKVVRLSIESSIILPLTCTKNLSANTCYAQDAVPSCTATLPNLPKIIN